MYYTGKVYSTEELIQYARSICNAFDPLFYLRHQQQLKINQEDYIVPYPSKNSIIFDSNIIRENNLEIFRKNIPKIKQSFEILLPFVVLNEVKKFYENSSIEKLQYIRENSTEIHEHRIFYQESIKYSLHPADAIILSIARLHNSILISRDLQIFEAAHLNEVTVYPSLQDFIHRHEITKHFN